MIYVGQLVNNINVLYVNLFKTFTFIFNSNNCDNNEQDKKISKHEEIFYKIYQQLILHRNGILLQILIRIICAICS